MKLKGIGLIVPLVDLRPLCAPRTRFHFLSPYTAKPGHTRLKGFGAAMSRKLRNPWRAGETIYFRSRGAIALPRRLPDGYEDQVGAGVTNSCARVYFDDGATVRFDLSIFTNPRHQDPPSIGNLDYWVKGYWNEDFSFYDNRQTSVLKCPSAYERLVQKFVNVSGPRLDTKPNLVEVLAPLVIAVAQADEGYIADSPTSLDDNRTLFAETRPISVQRFKDKFVEAVLIAYSPGHYLQPTHNDFDRLRKARMIAACLHTDFQVLLALTQHVLNTPEDETKIRPYVEDLVDALTHIPTVSTEEGLDVSAFHALYSNPLILISGSLERLGLQDAARKLKEALKPPARANNTVYGGAESSSASFRRPPITDIERSSLDPLLTEAMDRYTIWLKTGSLNGARYSDALFRESAIRKAKEVVTKLPVIRPYVIVSVGGADGTELFELMTQTKSSNGVLLEFFDESTERAKQEAARRPINLVTLTGDATQKIDSAMREARSLSTKAGGIPILVTIMAVLHELPTRSPGFDLLEFFASLRDADVLIGREPVEPSNWSQPIILSGNFDARLFARFTNDVLLGRFAQLHPPTADMRVKVLAANKVRGHRGLILEALVKAFYRTDLLYELNECVTWFSEEGISRQLHCCFDDTHYTNTYGGSPSLSMSRFWRLYGLRAEANETYQRQAMPGSHLWYEAISKTLNT